MLCTTENAVEEQYQSDHDNQTVAYQFDLLRDGFKGRKIGGFYNKVEGEDNDNTRDSMKKGDEIPE